MHVYAKVTPAVVAATKAGIDFELLEYEHDRRVASYGAEAAAALNLDPARVFKTLIVDIGPGALAVGLVPVIGTLDLKQFARLLGAKRAELADPGAAERATGYLLGGVSPFGQRKRLPFAIDSSVFDCPKVYVSAGKRGLEMALAPRDLVMVLNAKTGSIAR